MANLKNISVGGVSYGLGLTLNEIKSGIGFDSLQQKLKAGAGIAIEADGTIKTTLDTDVFKIVEALPTQPEAGNENKIHVAPNAAGEGQNVYNEYIWANGKWEEVGSFKADVDLSDYAKTADVVLKAGYIAYSQTEKDKLAGIAENANNYVHPESHPASMIVEAANKRFMKDAERTKLEGISESANKVSFNVNGETLEIVVE